MAKLVKDLIVRKAITWVKAAAPIIGLVLLLLVLVVAMIAVPVIAVIAILYNSPFALFLPPLESGDTVQTVTSAYVQEFNRDVNTKVNEHTGYDLGELVYVDYEGMEENPSNYYDIMAVYMVKHGVGDTATVMNDTSKGWLQAVVNDMWKKVGRYVKRGAKGCAIFPSRALNPRMRYIFDISDTGGKNVKLTLKAGKNVRIKRCLY